MASVDVEVKPDLFANPWQVDDVVEFSFYCCPECIYRSKTVPEFQVHAIVNHPNSKDFFQRYGDKIWTNVSGEDPELPENAPMKVWEQEEPSDNPDEIRVDTIKKEATDEDFDPEISDTSANACATSSLTTSRSASTKAANKSCLDMVKKEGQRYKCPDCDVTCPTKSKMRIHIESVHEKKKVPCPECSKMFSKAGLRNHIKYYHNVDRVAKPYKCDECDFASHAMKYLKAHRLNCHDKERQKHKCEKCGERFPFPSLLKSHDCDRARAHSREANEPVQCGECSQTLKAPQYLVNHYKKVHGRLPPGYENKQKFMCDKCTSVFFNEFSLKHHMKTKHGGGSSGAAVTVCPDCGQEFNAVMYFVQHYKYVHGGLPPGFEDKAKFMCDQCPSVFFNAVSLKSHYKTKHSTVAKDKAQRGRRSCPHCEKTFATYLSYKEHIKSKHENDTPYKCDECHRSYGTSGRLRVHKKNMHQRIKCDECGQEICNAFILKRHKASVHGITPAGAFQCEHCPSFFVNAKIKAKHVLKHHVEAKLD